MDSSNPRARYISLFVLSCISIFCASGSRWSSGIYSLHRQEGAEVAAYQGSLAQLGWGEEGMWQPQLGVCGECPLWLRPCRKLPQLETGCALPQGVSPIVGPQQSRAINNKIKLNQYPSMKTILAQHRHAFTQRFDKAKGTKHRNPSYLPKHYIQCFVKYFYFVGFFQIFYGQCHLIQKSFQEIHLLFASLIVPWCQT